MNLCKNRAPVRPPDFHDAVVRLPPGVRSFTVNDILCPNSCSRFDPEYFLFVLLTPPVPFRCDFALPAVFAY